MASLALRLVPPILRANLAARSRERRSSLLCIINNETGRRSICHARRLSSMLVRRVRLDMPARANRGFLSRARIKTASAIGAQ